MLEYLLVFRIEPGGLRRYFVHDSHIGHQIVIQQISHEITADETTSCNRKRIKVSLPGRSYRSSAQRAAGAYRYNIAKIPHLLKRSPSLSYHRWALP